MAKAPGPNQLLKTLESIANGVRGEARLPYLMMLSCLILMIVATWSEKGWLKWTPLIVMTAVVAVCVVWALVVNRKRFRLSVRDRTIIVRMYNVEKKSRSISSLIHASQAAVLDLFGKIIR